MIKISPDTKFSYNLIKGSVSSRKKYASNLNQQVFDSLELSMKGNSSQVSDLENTICEVLPEDKNIKILKNANKNVDGASAYLYDSSENIIGQTLEIPTKKGKFGTKVLVTVMHELTHILDSLSNPKYISRACLMTKQGKYNNSFYRWYDGVLYAEEKYKTDNDKKKCLKIVKDKTEKFLKGKSPEEKLNYIQDARYTLETERNAHNEQLKYAKILNSQHKEIYDTDLEDCDKVYLFTEKINLLKQMGLDTVSEIRKTQKKRCH